MRTSKPPEERKQEIIQTGLRLFAEKGIDKTKISDIVNEIGVAKGLFYYYFNSKDELIKEIVHQQTIKHVERINLIMEDQNYDFYNKLSILVDVFLEDYHLFDLELLNEVIDKEQLEKHFLNNIRKLIDIGVNEGKLSIKYPQETTLMLFYGLKYLCNNKLNLMRLTYLTLIEQTLYLPKGTLIQNCS